MSAPTGFYVVLTNHTRRLLDVAPPWGTAWSNGGVRGLTHQRSAADSSIAVLGRRWQTLPLHVFQQTHWTALKHVVRAD